MKSMKMFLKKVCLILAVFSLLFVAGCGNGNTYTVRDMGGGDYEVSKKGPGLGTILVTGILALLCAASGNQAE